MTLSVKSQEYQLHDDILHDYAAGRLSPAKSAILAQHAKINPQAANDMAFEDTLSAVMMEYTETRDLSPGFFEKVLGSLPDQSQKPSENLFGRLNDIPWKTWLPGLSTYDLIGDRQYGGDRLFLLKMRAGKRIWEHTHKGDEWVLVLQGAYEAEGVVYKKGDLHIEDTATAHTLRAEPGEDCICLIMLDNPITMKSWLGKGLARYMGL